MDRDHFIITVYCLVCEHYQAIKARYHIRRGGFAPALTDEEVITIEICGEYFKGGTDKDIFAAGGQSVAGQGGAPSALDGGERAGPGRGAGDRHAAAARLRLHPQ